MTNNSKNLKFKRKFFTLSVLTLSILFTTSQRIVANEPFDFLTKSFSLGNILNPNPFSPQSVFVVNTTGDQNDQLPGDGFCNDGAGNCSLRGAIQEANTFAGANVINFDIPGGCDQIISPNSQLPAITDSVTIDGYTQSGSLTNTAATGDNAKLCVILYGINAGNDTDGLQVNAVNTTVRGLAISKFSDAGIQISANSAIIEGNFIGTDSPGTGILSNRLGIVVQANNVRIGGTTLPSRNIISGNTRYGITLFQGSGNNVVQNNYVGLGANSAALGNGETGISIFRSGGNTIGGAMDTARNVISGNGTSASGGLDGSGISIYGDTQFNQSPNNTISGNYIGTNPAGTGAIANKTNGILINGAINTTIAGNLVSGNTVDGIGITGAGATGNVVKSNVVGLDYQSFNALGNSRDGVSILQVGGNTIGGTNAGDGNRIGGNGNSGVQIAGAGGENNLVQGNSIGFSTYGSARGQLTGIAVFSNNNTIGGTTAGARNYIAGNSGCGIRINLSSGVSVLGNNIGILADGATLNIGDGIIIQDSTDNFIGGTAAGAGNLISGNQYGIHLIKDQMPTTGNQILGNLIGIKADGTTAAGNVYGIYFQKADNNIIGGTTAAARNVISGNLVGGYLDQSADNQISGNYIGTSIDGLTALPNGIDKIGAGILLLGPTTSGNVIGGTTSGAGNVISGNNGDGVRINASAASNRVEGNIIGLNASGTAALPNSVGITFNISPSGNIIGGTAAGAGNVISGNTGDGILFTEGSNGNFVQGNKIGTDAAGMIAFPNGDNGVKIFTGGANTPVTNNVIGGSTTAARNIISGNEGGGIEISGQTSKNNGVAGNYIGTTADGNSSLPNAIFGVLIDAPNTSVGGIGGTRNIISGQSGNSASGILVYSKGSGSLIQNNYIGTNADGSGAVGNFYGIQLVGSGITIDSNVISGNINKGIVTSTVPNGGSITNNKIGTNAAGTAFLGNGTGISINFSSFFSIGEATSGATAPNIIAGNAGNGIEVVGDGSVKNIFRQNSIYGNGGLGIDLGKDGVTQNDAQDTDTGSNNKQNFPVINTATTTITGSLNSTPNRNFRIEYYSSPTADASGYGEGQTYLAEQTISTDANGNATFSVSNPQPLGSYISATATDRTTGDTSEFSAYKQTLAPTAVSFNGARATALENGVLVEWQTGRESDNLGFNIYREKDGKREVVNKNLVAGSALTARENLLSEQNYSWLDENGDKDSAYLIESVDVRGVKETFGAFQAETSAKSGKNNVADSTTLNQLGSTETAATVAIEPTVKLNAKLTEQQTKIQNALAANKTVKLTVRRAGIYRVSAEQLLANGLPANTNAANLQLFADGIEQPINVINAENGVFGGNSAIEFYGAGTNTTETDARTFYLVASSNIGLRMSKTDAEAQPATANFYDATVERRDRTIYFSGLLNGDDDNFFGAVVNNAGTNQIINASQLAEKGGAAELEISLQGVTRSQHSVNVELNGSLISTFNFDESKRGLAKISLQTSQLREGENTVRLIANNQGDVSVVDYLRLTYPHLYRAENNSLYLSANGGQEISVSNFTSKNIRVFDVTNPNETLELTTHLQKTKVDGTNNSENGSLVFNKARSYSVTFTTTGSGTRDLLAIADDKFAFAESVVADNPSNLRNRKNAADLLILTRREFFESLAPLVEMRTKQGLVVNLVDVADIYDEFSFGQKSTAAIKNFLNYAQTSWRGKPQFVLLAGDATFDPKGYVGNLSADVVQTKLVDTESMETASDEWLVDFDGDGVGEMAIGRLPVRSASETKAVVAKIVNYESQKPSNSATFVADLNDGYDFANANNSVISSLPPSFKTNEIRRADDNAKTQLLSAIADGQSIVSYSGHGSSSIWRGNLLTNVDAVMMRNGDRLPMFVMMTCLNGYFQDVRTDSLSETLLKNPRGGAVAVWSSSGTTTPDSQTELNRQFVQSLNYQNPTIGQAVRRAKTSVSNKTIRQTWTLFGDPTMRLK